jgi:hypothetical protein
MNNAQTQHVQHTWLPAQTCAAELTPFALQLPSPNMLQHVQPMRD